MKSRDTTGSISLSAPHSKVEVGVVRQLLRGSRCLVYEIKLLDKGLPILVLVFRHLGSRWPVLLSAKPNLWFQKSDVWPFYWSTISSSWPVPYLFYLVIGPSAASFLHCLDPGCNAQLGNSTTRFQLILLPRCQKSRQTGFLLWGFRSLSCMTIAPPVRNLPRLPSCPWAFSSMLLSWSFWLPQLVCLLGDASA